MRPVKHMTRRNSCRGMTLVELIVAFTILLVLTSMAVPVARTNVRRMKERQLREACKKSARRSISIKIWRTAGKLGDPEDRTAMVIRRSLECAGGWREGFRAGGRYEAQVSAPHSAGPDDEHARMGPAQHAGRSEEQRLGRPECFRRVYKERWTKRPMERLMPSGKAPGLRKLRRVHADRDDDRDGDHRHPDLGCDPVLSESDYPRERDAFCTTTCSRCGARSTNTPTTNRKRRSHCRIWLPPGICTMCPRDPITQDNTSWKIIMEDAGQAVSSSEPGIFDVGSSSNKIGLDGTHYSDW